MATKPAENQSNASVENQQSSGRKASQLMIIRSRNETSPFFTFAGKLQIQKMITDYSDPDFISGKRAAMDSANSGKNGVLSVIFP